VVQGDYLKKIPHYGDALLWIRNMHDYSPEVRKVLAKNAFDALTPGGKLLIVEGLRNPKTIEVYQGYVYSAIPTENVWFYPYSFGEYKSLLKEAGFSSIKSIPLTGGIFYIISAEKRK